MKRLLILLAALGWICSGIASAQALDTLFISTSQVVHIRFASELKYVNLGSKSIIARIVDGSKDFVAVKAREPFEDVTSLTCLEANGRMHTFLTAYREHPARLEVDTRQQPYSQITAGPSAAATAAPASRRDSTFSFSPSRADGLPSASSFTFEDITAMKQELFHIGTRGYDIDILCENILIKDDILYLLISIKNGSAVSYDLTNPRFSIESKRRTRRGLQYEKALFPRNSYGLGTISPGSTEKLVFSFDKVTLTHGQVFRIYFYENGGSRNFTLTLGLNDVNRARGM